MGRTPCCDKMGLKKGPWTPDEDQKLVTYIQRNGHGSWRALPKHAGLLRCGKSCRLRWTNYLRPDIKRGRFSFEEEQVIIHLHGILGNRWSAIAAHLPGRTDNEIKNYWNTHLRKRLLQMGIDPVTHKVRSNLLIENLDLKPMVSSTLSHMSQWDRVRMEMEARLSSDYFAKSSAHGAAIFEASGTSASFIKAPSDCSMRSWKTQVSESLLRRDFGVLEKLPPCSMDLQTVLQDWEDSLHCQPMEPGLYDSQMRAKTHSGSHSGYSQTPRNDNCSGTTVTDLAARFETFPSFHQTSPSPSPLPQTSQISDSFTSSGTKLFPDLPKPNSLPSMIPEHFSPTSTLSSPFGTSPSDFMVPPPSSNCEIAFSTSPPLQLPSPTFWTSLSAPTTMGAGDLQLPSEIPELLMELHAEPAVPDLIVATVPTTTAGTPGWTSQQGLIESKDYWANMLHLVGPPASQQLSTLLSTPARLTR